MKTLFTLFIGLTASALLAQSAVTVTNTADAGPGSFRQALLDANANAGIDTIKFNIPTSDGGYNVATGVFTIQISSAALPAILNRDLYIDGSSQTAFTGNSNSTIFGTGGTVGVDGLSLSQVDGPEIEIIDGGNFPTGLRIERRNVTLRQLAMSGFGNTWFSSIDANVLVLSGGVNTHIIDCVLGARAAFDAPLSGDVNGGSNLQVLNGDNGSLTGSYIAYSEAMGAYMRNFTQGWNVSNNEFYANGQSNDICDGLDIAYNSSNFSVIGNLFKNNGGIGLDTYLSTGGHTFENNTSVGNGLLGRETAGMRIYGGQGSTIRRNLIYQNVGAGVLVTSDARKHIITENSFYDNGNQLPTGGSTLSQQIAIDLLNSSDSHEKGSAPFITLNDDGDGDLGGNDLLNFPVIESAVLSGGNLSVSGFAPAGAKIEFYRGDLYPGAVMPQGRDFLFARTEGSVDDADASTGAYGPGVVNGTVQGAESAANRFSFTVPAPAGLNASDVLTATATLVNSGTSEFGGAYSVSSGASAVAPNLECVYIDVNGDLVARFGYNNPNATAVNEAIGANNQFSPGPANQGQPTIFSPGLQNSVFDLTFPSANTRTWTLQGSSVTASTASVFCPADLEVIQSVDNNTPSGGDTVTFTITLNNLTSNVPATAVELSYYLDFHFVFISAAASSGTYNPTTQRWLIPEVVNGSPQTLTIKAQVFGTGTNVATIMSQNQPDPNLANNSASETVVVSGGSSGGFGGGIESEGSMAQLIAGRNFERLKTGAHRFYDHLDQAPSLQEAKANRGLESVGLLDFLPVTGPQNSLPTITTPTDLIGITNAVQVKAADYFTTSGSRLGVILAMETQNEVYNHTKIICDRLNGAKLNELKSITIDGHPFILTRLDQENGEIDYAVSFVAYRDSSGSFTVDNRYIQGAYNSQNQDEIYNFQVWTVSESLTRDLVNRVLAQIKGEGPVSYLNNGNPILPTVYVESGYYRDGTLYLDLVNTVGASLISLEANSTKHEGANRENFLQLLPLDSSKTRETVAWNVGYLFDAGFSLTNNLGGGTDVLYFADGPWGVDFERGTGVSAPLFNTFEEVGYNLVQNELHLERRAQFSGNLKNYVSVYRMLRPGNGAADLSDYNQLEFEASLAGFSEMVVTLVSDSIEEWHNQFKITVPVQSAGMQSYRVDFADFRSLAGGLIRSEDIVSVTFSVVGDQNTFQAVQLELDNLNFTKNGKTIGLSELANQRSGLNVYPNPMSHSTFIDLNVPASGQVEIQLLDLSGKLVDQQKITGLVSGAQTLQYAVPAPVPNGVYLMKVGGQGQWKSQRVIVRR